MRMSKIRMVRIGAIFKMIMSRVIQKTQEGKTDFFGKGNHSDCKYRKRQDSLEPGNTYFDNNSMI